MHTTSDFYDFIEITIRMAHFLDTVRFHARITNDFSKSRVEIFENIISTKSNEQFQCANTLDTELWRVNDFRKTVDISFSPPFLVDKPRGTAPIILPQSNHPNTSETSIAFKDGVQIIEIVNEEHRNKITDCFFNVVIADFSRKIQLESRSIFPFCIPWEKSDCPLLSFSPEIGKSLYQLLCILPVDSRFLSILSGRDMPYYLNEMKKRKE